MKLSCKNFILVAFMALFACFVSPVSAGTFAEKGRELGQKLDDAEAKLKKEAAEAKMKAEEAAAKLKKKVEKVAEVAQEEISDQNQPSDEAKS